MVFFLFSSHWRSCRLLFHWGSLLLRGSCLLFYHVHFHDKFSNLRRILPSMKLQQSSEVLWKFLQSLKLMKCNAVSVGRPRSISTSMDPDLEMRDVALFDCFFCGSLKQFPFDHLILSILCEKLYTVVFNIFSYPFDLFHFFPVN